MQDYTQATITNGTAFIPQNKTQIESDISSMQNQIAQLQNNASSYQATLTALQNNLAAAQSIYLQINQINQVTPPQV